MMAPGIGKTVYPDVAYDLTTWGLHIKNECMKCAGYPSAELQTKLNTRIANAEKITVVTPSLKREVIY